MNVCRGNEIRKIISIATLIYMGLIRDFNEQEIAISLVTNEI